ncbi:MAG TPA: hypothetical protein VFR24_14895 [Candidatus Angelobacter sp.]|nr:hypothetical protein [Candidatus Angelobacter sp.]
MASETIVVSWPAAFSKVALAAPFVFLERGPSRVTATARSNAPV